MAKHLSEKKKKLLRIAGYGAVGSIAGDTLRFHTGGPHALHTVGVVAGLATGSVIESRLAKKRGVPQQEESVGEKKFQRRVGTKTQGRVAKRDHPYMVGGRK